MFISKHLIVNILSVIFALRSRLVFIFTHKGLLFVDEGVEGFKTISRIIFKLSINKLEFGSQNVLNSVDVHFQSTKDFSAGFAIYLVKKLIIFIEK